MNFNFLTQHTVSSSVLDKQHLCVMTGPHSLSYTVQDERIHIVTLMSLKETKQENLASFCMQTNSQSCNVQREAFTNFFPHKQSICMLAYLPCKWPESELVFVCSCTNEITFWNMKQWGGVTCSASPSTNRSRNIFTPVLAVVQGEIINI